MTCAFSYRPSLFFLLLFVSGWGCEDRITGDRRANQPPRTHVWVDTVATTLTSRVRIRWSGDDPDGFVKGYFVSVGSGWTFSTVQDSTFSIPLGSVDSIIREFRVAAVDAEGNGRWDSSVLSGSEVLGPEPFFDADSNGAWSSGEAFTDLGLADPEPARLALTITNTPPTVRFAAQTNVPTTTLPAASFMLQGSDLDGNETIVRYRVALNQPDTTQSGWVEIPGSSSLLALLGNVEESGDTITAKILLGSQMAPAGNTLPGLRLNSNNVLYVYCEDLAGARSSVVRMPDTSGSWFVKRPNPDRRLLLVNDYGAGNPDPATVYGAALDLAQDAQGGTYGTYDMMSLISNPLPAPIHKTMLIATFSMYKSVFWFGRIANLNYAQNSIPEYLASGGKVLFVTGFQNFIDPQGLPIDFLPIDSLVTSYTDTSGSTRFGFIPRVYLNSRVVSMDTLEYPTLVYGSTFIFGSYAVVEAPNQDVIYRLDLPKNPPNAQETWVGTPAVGVRSESRNIILMTIPLHITNTGTPNRLVQFLQRVFRDEFGV